MAYFAFLTLVTLVASNYLISGTDWRELVNNDCKPPAGDLKLPQCEQPVRPGMSCPTDHNPQCRDQWYYDNRTGECLHFSYAGCSGNTNNFGSKQDCEKKCKPQEVKSTS
ncbi:kunitz-type serine protease inhibitor PILP-3-like [Dermacentor silvarum]|uniref:kunitz-type serine protease inhibitor PILP-3-like n=1 Tax=Dermacentor silvarum TaxID=543639 RepID=UPI002101931D|nr:kunitz-type serine protease inhibitor PILP-3-like [Dermacentor silvarum]